MNFEIWEYSGELLNDHPHGEGMQIFLDQSIFAGRWEKGLKVGEGVFELQDITIKVKFKAGKIHKFLEINSNSQDFNTIELKQPNYNQIGDFFCESPEGSTIFLHYYQNVPLFDGHPSRLKTIKASINPPYSIFYKSEEKSKLYEIQAQSYHYIGNMVQYIPFGKAKFRLENNFYVKGVARAGYMTGICKIKNEKFSLIFNADAFPYVYTYRVISKELKTDDEIYLMEKCQFFNQNSCAKNNQEVLDFISSSHFALINFLIQFSYVSKKNYSIHASINLERKWDLFEIFMSEKSKTYENLRKMKAKNARGKDKERVNHFEKFKNQVNEIEKDQIIGSLDVRRVRFCTNELFLGEFNGNSKNGLGILRFSDGTVFRGYFYNDQIHGRGKYQGKNFILIGFWRFNKLVMVHRIILDNSDN